MRVRIISTMILSIIVTGLLSANISKEVPPDRNLNLDRARSSADMMEDNSVPGFSIPALKSALDDYGPSPYWNRVDQFGGTGPDFARDVATDSNGNVYLTGVFSGDVSIGGNDLTSVGARDAFVAKFDVAGSLVWITQLNGTPGNWINTFKMKIGSDNSIYITGSYQGDVNFGGYILTGDHSTNLYYAKLGSDGVIQMAKSHPTTFDVENGFDIELDDLGNIYVLAALDNNTANFRSPSIIIKYDPAGTLLWEQQHDERFSGIEIAGSNLFLTGYIESNYGQYDGPMDGILDSLVTIPHPYGYGDAFVARADLAGDFQWGQLVNHINPTGAGDSYSQQILADSLGNLFLTGNFRTDIVLGSDTLEASNGYYIARCSPAGVFQWAHQSSLPVKIAFDDAGKLLVSEANELSQFDMATGNKMPVDTLPMAPQALATYIDTLTPAENARYAIKEVNSNMVMVKRDQNFDDDWYIDFPGNTGTGEVFGMVSDDQGNLYTYGKITGSVDFFGHPLQGGMFLSKQDIRGDVVWIKEIPGPAFTSGTDNLLAIDPANENIYITAPFCTNTDIGGDVQLTPISGCNAFVAKYGVDGTYKWVYHGDIEVGDLCLAPDYSGNVIFSGTFHHDSIMIGPYQLDNAGDRDVFITKLNSSGIPQWAIRTGGEATEYMGLITTDNLDNIYLSGEFTSMNVTVDAAPVTMNEGDGNMMFTKLDKDGNVLWIKPKAGSAINFGDGTCWPTSMVTDPGGNSYIKGWHGDSIYFDSELLTATYGAYNYFITKFDSSGNTLWANSVGEKQYGFDYNQMDIDVNGSVYFGAQAKDTLWFGTDHVFPGSGNIDLFVAKYKPEGGLEWVKTIDGSTGHSNIGSIAVWDTNHIYVGGHMNDYLGFSGVDLISPNRHGFIALLSGGSPLSISFTKQDVYGIDGKTGSIDVTPVGGLSPYTYVWSNGATTEDIDSLMAGDYTVTVTDDLGTVDSLTIQIEEFDTICYVTADFTFVHDVDTHNLVKFTSTIDGPFASHTWAFGDSLGSTDPNPMHLYNAPGLYEVSLTVTDSAGYCLIVIIDTVEVLDLSCDAEFDYTVTDLVVEFTSLGIGMNKSYSWVFGDGYLSNLSAPTHSYSRAGVYDVCLTVYDTISGCMEENCFSVEVGTVICSAGFIYNHDAGDQKLVRFTSSVGGQIDNYYWMFGDGYVSTDKDPAHTYGVPGNYYVTLTVIDTVAGCMDQAEAFITIGDVECNADFSYYIDSASNTANFSAKDSNDNSIFYWSFGDGNLSDLKNPSHVFEYPGFYKVSLSVFDDVSGCLDYLEKIILVGGGEDVEADFIYQAQETGTSVSFQDQSLGKELTLLWDFGDGEKSTETNPDHKYALGGYYDVCLNAYSASGLQNITCKTIFVGSDASQDCLAKFAFLVDNASKTVTYTDKSFGTPDVWAWDFGDGKSSILQSPENIFANAGYYTTQFTIENSTTNCRDYDFKLVNVDEEGGYVAGFGYIIDSSDKKADTYPVDFVGVSLGEAGKLKWDFGDGTIDTTSMSPTHTYTSPGIYTACLYLSDPNTGQADTSCQTITVGGGGVGFRDIRHTDMELTCFPNPFNEYTTVEFELKDQRMVDLALYDLMGRKVQQLLREKRQAGRHLIDLDGTALESGHYYLMLRTPNAIERTAITIAR